MGDAPEPTPTFVLNRGVYSDPGERVEPAGLASVLAWDDRWPRNRLGLARWLFDPRQPLTARVFVNRVWQMHFGRGIVETSEDFGSQGAIPTHPELLDWLAVEFVESALNVSGAFHSELMRAPGAQLAAALDAATFADAAVPVIANVTAQPETRGAELRRLLARQIDSPVRWEESMRALRAAYAGPVLEVGSGAVLRGLLKRIDRDAVCTSVGDRAGVEALVAKTATG